MDQKTVKIPFKWYDSLEKQNRYKSYCNPTEQFKLNTKPDRMLPFIIKRTADGYPLGCVKVYTAVDNTLLQTISNSNFPHEVHTTGTFDYLFYYGAIVTGLSLTCGVQYYAALEIGGETYYSEVFTAETMDLDNNDFTRIEWKHSHDIGDIIYSTGYVNRIYVETFELAEPEYSEVSEVEEDEQGNENVVFTKDVKVYKFNLIGLPEYMTDAINRLPMHDQTDIYLKNNLDDFTDLKNIETDIDWTSSCYATAEVKFRYDPEDNSYIEDADVSLTQVVSFTDDTPVITISSFTPESSAAASDGSVTFSVTGGFSPYTYSINGTDYQSSPTFSNLTADSYTVYVKDSDGCEVTTYDFEMITSADCSAYAGSDANDIIALQAAQIKDCFANDFV